MDWSKWPEPREPPPELHGEELERAEVLLAREGFPTTRSIAALHPAQRDAMIEDGLADARNARLDEIARLSREEREAAYEAAMLDLKTEVADRSQPLAPDELGVFGQADRWSLDEALMLAFGLSPRPGARDWMRRNWTLDPFPERLVNLLWKMDLALERGPLTDPVGPQAFLRWVQQLQLAPDAPAPAMVDAVEGIAADQPAGQAQVDPAQDYLDRAQVMSMFRISRNTVDNWIRDGRLPPPLKIGRKNLWRRAELEAIVRRIKPGQQKP